MTLQELGVIGELLGAVAVLATLGYLSVQTRQFRIAAEQAAKLSAIQATHSAGDLYARWRTLLLSNPSYVAILVKASEGNELTSVEHNIVATLFHDLFVTGAYSHHVSQELGSFHKGSVDTDYILENLRRYPCGIAEWNKFKSIAVGVGPKFVEQIDKHLDELPNDA